MQVALPQPAVVQLREQSQQLRAVVGGWSAAFHVLEGQHQSAAALAAPEQLRGRQTGRLQSRDAALFAREVALRPGPEKRLQNRSAAVDRGRRHESPPWLRTQRGAANHALAAVAEVHIDAKRQRRFAPEVGETANAGDRCRRQRPIVARWRHGSGDARRTRASLQALRSTFDLAPEARRSRSGRLRQSAAVSHDEPAPVHARQRQVRCGVKQGRQIPSSPPRRQRSLLPRPVQVDHRQLHLAGSELAHLGVEVRQVAVAMLHAGLVHGANKPRHGHDQPALECHGRRSGRPAAKEVFQAGVAFQGVADHERLAPCRIASALAERRHRRRLHAVGGERPASGVFVARAEHRRFGGEQTLGDLAPAHAVVQLGEVALAVFRVDAQSAAVRGLPMHFATQPEQRLESARRRSRR